MSIAQLTNLLYTLNDENLQAVQKFVVYLSDTQGNGSSGKTHRTPGTMKGKVYMSDDFDDPIEDMKEYM